MDLGELIALSGIVLGALILAGGMVGAWAFGRMQGERRALEGRPDSQSDERLGRLERMIEAMALDMERLAEGQRYIARQLPRAEGSPRPAVPESKTRV